MTPLHNRLKTVKRIRVDRTFDFRVSDLGLFAMEIEKVSVFGYKLMKAHFYFEHVAI